MKTRQAVCLVTGANSGIGYATALELAKQDATVVMVCRSQYRGTVAQEQIVLSTGNPNVHLLTADLTLQKDVRQLIDDVQAQFSNLNVLINNAGAMFMQRELTSNSLERTFALNHMAYFMLANGLLETLLANVPARIINVTSGSAYNGSIQFENLQGEQNYSRRQAYEQSKLANVLFTAELARLTADKEITVNCFNPGNVLTNLGGVGRKVLFTVRRVLFPSKYKALNVIPVEQVGSALAYLALDASVSQTTGVCYTGKDLDSSFMETLYDPETAKRLWNISDALRQSSKEMEV